MPSFVKSRLSIIRCRRDGTGLVRAETNRHHNGAANGLECAILIDPRDNTLFAREVSACEVYDDRFHRGLMKVEWERADGRSVSLAFGEHVPYGGTGGGPVLKLDLEITSYFPSEDEGHPRTNPESGRSVASRRCRRSA